MIVKADPWLAEVLHRLALRPDILLTLALDPDDLLLTEPILMVLREMGQYPAFIPSETVASTSILADPRTDVLFGQHSIEMLSGVKSAGAFAPPSGQLGPYLCNDVSCGSDGIHSLKRHHTYQPGDILRAGILLLINWRYCPIGMRINQPHPGERPNGV